MWLNNCERKLSFSIVSYEVIFSEFTFEQYKQYFVNSSFIFHSMKSLMKSKSNHSMSVSKKMGEIETVEAEKNGVA